MMRHVVVAGLLIIGAVQVVYATPASEPSPGPQYPFIPALTFAKEGEVLIWGETAGNNRDRCKLVWCDALSGKLLKPINGFESFGFSHGSVAASKDGRFLAATPFSDGVRVWDVQNQEPLILAEKPLNSTALTFVPSDNTLLVKYAKDIVAYDVPSLQRKGIFQKTFTGRVFGGAPQSQSIAVSADGKRLAGFFNGVRLWDVASGRQLAEIQGPTDEFKRVAISPDGNLVAYSTRGPTRVWDYRTQAERFKLEGKFRYLTVAFSPTEDILAVSSKELGLHFVDTNTGQVVRRFIQFPAGAYPVAFSPDGKRIAAAHGGEIRIIDLDTEAEVVIKIPPLDEKIDQ